MLMGFGRRLSGSKQLAIDFRKREMPRDGTDPQPNGFLYSRLELSPSCSTGCLFVQANWVSSKRLLLVKG